MRGSRSFAHLLDADLRKITAAAQNVRLTWVDVFDTPLLATAVEFAEPIKLPSVPHEEEPTHIPYRPELSTIISEVGSPSISAHASCEESQMAAIAFGNEANSDRRVSVTSSLGAPTAPEKLEHV